MKLKLILLFTFFNSILYAQEMFPGKDISMISGRQLQVKPLREKDQSYGYNGFYKDEKLKNIYDCCAADDFHNSRYRKLADKVFTVISITPYMHLDVIEKFKIKITNPETGDLYYDYDPLDESKWVFHFFGAFEKPADYYCGSIEQTTNKFEDDTTYRTQKVNGFSLLKKKNGERSAIYLVKEVYNPVLYNGDKDFVLLLENRNKIERKEVKMDVRDMRTRYGYVYSASIMLTDNEISLLLQNAITDYSLQVFEGTVNDNEGKLLIELLKCLTTK